MQLLLTECVVDRFVLPLQSNRTHGCNLPRRLHPGIDHKPGAGESCPLLKAEGDKELDEYTDRHGTVTGLMV